MDSRDRIMVIQTPEIAITFRRCFYQWINRGIWQMYLWTFFASVSIWSNGGNFTENNPPQLQFFVKFTPGYQITTIFYMTWQRCWTDQKCRLYFVAGFLYVLSEPARFHPVIVLGWYFSYPIDKNTMADNHTVTALHKNIFDISKYKFVKISDVYWLTSSG